MASYDSVLSFTRKILDNFKIPSYISDGDSLQNLPLDGHLREQLFHGYDYKNASRNTINLCGEHMVCFSQDMFFCRYTIMRLPNQEKPVFFLAGPYIFQTVDQHFLLNIQQTLAIPSSHMKYLQRYYLSVPFIEFEDYLRSTLLLLAAELYGGAGQFDINYCKGFLDDAETFHYSLTAANPDALDLLEKRYQEENRLLKAVTAGNFNEAQQMLSQTSLLQYEKRLPNHLRDHKNHLIIFNTLMRKSAEIGGVHPLYLDDISSQFARKIERISSDAQYCMLMREMLRKYCMLVRSYSTKGYSPIIQKVMNHIPLNLAEDLSLKTLASLFTVSPSYLSSLFKKETGSTLTEYVNHKRIEQALFLLNSTDLYIQTIAVSCGIPDLNYFTKVFKKQTGKTPSEYRALIHEK
ncbi:AraC family transcriptional regulator [Clostridium sp. chh4-2]|uniref:AraC family transcriptional regulator n=1 Tax=Clostridium sp. chh4-2 TaxID=2067550 RepID=UPI000CCE771C|nr:helix-turn-helix domain-containing protein [Clostridium sp. chh4-2]PNV61116.1 AraC family transcriptional regulator [Clostridium sp. chh4-2]